MSPVGSEGKGTWRQIAVVSDGKEVAVARGGLLHSRDDGYEFTVNGRAYQKGTVKHDYGKLPHQSEVMVSEGLHAGETLSQIFQIHGDVLIACIAKPGEPRPTEFKSEPGSGHTLSVWMRVKGDSPALSQAAGRYRFVGLLGGILVTSSATQGLKRALEPSLGYWPAIALGCLGATILVMIVCLFLKWGWRAGIALGISLSITITVFEELRTVLEPTLGGPGAIAVCGSTACVAGMITGAISGKLLKHNWQ